MEVILLKNHFISTYLRIATMISYPIDNRFKSHFNDFGITESESNL